jgi:hypothetical protein
VKIVHKIKQVTLIEGKKSEFNKAKKHLAKEGLTEIDHVFSKGTGDFWIIGEKVLTKV